MKWVVVEWVNCPVCEGYGTVPKPHEKGSRFVTYGNTACGHCWTLGRVEHRRPPTKAEIDQLVAQAAEASDV